LSKNLCPNGIICDTAAAALGVMRAIYEQGYRVPTNLSVACFGNTDPEEQNKYPALTTVTLPMDQMGRKAFAMLLDRVNGSHKERRSAVVTPEMIIRASSR